jgi:hypothetical protein
VLGTGDIGTRCLDSVSVDISIPSEQTTSLKDCQSPPELRLASELISVTHCAFPDLIVARYKEPISQSLTSPDLATEDQSVK